MYDEVEIVYVMPDGEEVPYYEDTVEVELPDATETLI